ncbi:MAG TPA: hypothetical protein VF600_18240 [Abditibacteriaceae bacterium]
MSESTARYLFAMLCALGMLAIGVGAVLEITRFRRNARVANVASSQGDSADTGNVPLVPSGNVISLRQFRFRLLSAVIWMIVLGTLCYAITALWPERSSPQTLEQARRFLTAVCAALSLLLVAFALFIYDVIQLSRERRAQTARFYQGLAEMARTEAAQLQERQRLQASTTSSTNPAAADAPGAPALNSEAAVTESPAPTTDKTTR